MATSLTLMGKLASMLLMVILGIVIVRLKLVKETDSKPLSAIVVYVLQPALIIHSMQLTLTPERIRAFVFGLIFCVAVYVVWILLSIVLKKPFRLHAVDQATMIYSNAGNLTFPVVAMVLGEEAVFFVAALQIPFNLFIWSHGNQIISGEKKFHIRKVLLNSNIIALAVGLLLTAFHVELPDVLDTTITALQNAVAPVSMLVIGMVIANCSLKEIFGVKKAYLVLFGRLILFPAVAMLLLFATGIMKRFPEFIPVAMALFVGLSAPPASTVSQLAVLHDNHPVEAGTYNTLGMFLCLVTMPLMLFLYQLLFPR
ncbi:MAG: AEC family transporter [Lachnospiraceae bacterium]|nr:AEC family transporter [Lachnospiraceae bacterium]